MLLTPLYLKFWTGDLPEAGTRTASVIPIWRSRPHAAPVPGRRVAAERRGVPSSRLVSSGNV